jgi:uncharacterized RDD family membrane protein YckC
MDNLTEQTKQTEETEKIFKQSSKLRRIVSFMLDLSLFAFLMNLINFIIVGPDNMLDPTIEFDSMRLLFIIGFLIFLAKDSFRGISLGRWITGIMVRDREDFNITPSFWKLILRNITLLIWPIELIVLFISDKKKTRIGDDIAKSLVYNNPDKNKKLPRILSALALVLVFWGTTLYITGDTIKKSDAYRASIQIIESDQEIIKETGGITGYGYLPKGGININNGQGVSQLKINVHGKLKNMTVNIVLVKAPNGPWELYEIKK